ncbi:hypothetical protein FACS189447_04500 [Spirochaetia bacterium]|nr:hypothetical protein FACS189447_04500 [Spirochaetia bacterium]
MIWSTEKANNWYKNKGWIVGFNFLPSSAVNSTEMWQAESFDLPEMEKELALAAETGYNSCRVFLQYIVWKNEGEKFLKNFDHFLNATHKNNISVLPILFDDCAFSGREPYLGRQDEPRPGIHNSGWTSSPGFTAMDDPGSEEDLKAYVHAIVSRYKDDERILAWDLYNEPCNTKRDGKSLPLLRNVFKWARECNPSQPLTSGVWIWNEFDLTCIELSDIISFHDYDVVEKSKEHIAFLKKNNRPMLCTEWLHRPKGSTVESHMPLFKAEKIGIYNWGLVNGRTQTHLNWDASKNQGNTTQPWQHDIFTEDFKPYSEKEVEFIKQITR